MFFKRNQMEEAISRTLGERSSKPSSSLKTQIKRLLDLDRNLTRLPRSRDPERASFAFFDEAPPGRGVEVMFSAPNAFAVLTGVRMLDHGWPQSFVVSSLRQAKAELAARYRAIVSTPAQSIEATRHAPGEMAFPYPDSAFLLIISDSRTPASGSGSYVRFFENQNSAFLFQMEKVGRSCSWFGLESSARALHEHLLRSLPKHRGKGA
jgi:hypothetical protein